VLVLRALFLVEEEGVFGLDVGDLIVESEEIVL
jgi:hypothetical protein